ncbi:hypothetical protein PoB_007682400 [Plakobranchus ocellatus]|uniref:Uncharacterized protein n=1 Tax=Plakobranchus ocellatus TaxID=259542 RepID=A0AAV4E1G6_9GAST|nr:hypothetical protein PoB_007682400 [Plakobranchus ocellatus]
MHKSRPTRRRSSNEDELQGSESESEYIATGYITSMHRKTQVNLHCPHRDLELNKIDRGKQSGSGEE